MVHRLLTVLRISLLLIVAAAAADAADAGQRVRGDPVGFVTALGDSVIDVLATREATEEQRKKNLKSIFDEKFDVPTIGRRVLHRHWKDATPKQRKEYLVLLSEYVAKIYAVRFASYSGETIKILQDRAISETDTRVTLEVFRPPDPSFTVDIQVKNADGALRIVDIEVEGVSLIVATRSEFSSLASRKGIDGLLDKLKDLTR